MEFQKTQISALAVAGDFTAVLWDDGTVSASGKGVQIGRVKTKKINLWREITQIAAGETSGVAALTQHGTILLEGIEGYEKWRRAIVGWRNITSIALNAHCLAAVDQEGNVHCVGDEDAPQIDAWQNIKKVVLFGTFAVGVRLDGTVVCSTYQERNYWLDALSNWQEVEDITVGMQDSVAGNALYVAAVTRDGHVLCTAKYPVFEQEASALENITSLCGGMRGRLLAVKTDGSICQCPKETQDESFAALTGVTALAAAENCAVAVCAGQIAVLGDPDSAPDQAERASHVKEIEKIMLRAEKRGKWISYCAIGVGVMILALIWLTGFLRSYEITTPSGTRIASAPVFFTLVTAFVCLAIVCFSWPEKKEKKEKF